MKLTEIQNIKLKQFLIHFFQRTDFDKTLFLELCADTDEKTAIKMLAHFNENLKDCVEKLSQSLIEKNADMAIKAIHKITGSSELLGFKFYADRSRELMKIINADSCFDHHITELESYVNYTNELNSEITINFQELATFI